MCSKRGYQSFGASVLAERLRQASAQNRSSGAQGGNHHTTGRCLLLAWWRECWHGGEGLLHRETHYRVSPVLLLAGSLLQSRCITMAWFRDSLKFPSCRMSSDGAADHWHRTR